MAWTQWLAKIPKQQFVTKFSRSSGPGGQNVNKVSSKAQIRLAREALASAEWITPVLKQKLWAESAYATKSGDIIVVSELTRSQKNNLEDCFAKFAKEIDRLAFVPADPSEDAVKKWAGLRNVEKQKRKDYKQKHSQKKKDRKL